ncbi:spore maturation protein [Ruminococcus sp. OA3]|uniref:spore maturation protein n=1 Tax=Ruminococcus sp. OA3 TaxID=2914164 RepID=UPI001F069E96|nr:nucleoside recognition domain-containing protein [Ruminococcus sp. OA3]MCH1981768.1 spore maturation protein [Ruminococcus sp. OA3]
MKFLLFFSDMIIPLVIFYIVGFGLLMKQNVYESFVKGAKDGLITVYQIVPTLIGLMTAVGVLRASGLLELLGAGMGHLLRGLGFPAELVPLAVVKMFSSSAASGLLLDIYKEFGTDSMLGRTASIMMSCTETIFYTMSVYFIAAKVKKSRYTLAGALIATAAGIAASVFLAGRM